MMAVNHRTAHAQHGPGQACIQHFSAARSADPLQSGWKLLCPFPMQWRWSSEVPCLEEQRHCKQTCSGHRSYFFAGSGTQSDASGASARYSRAQSCCPHKAPGRRFWREGDSSHQRVMPGSSSSVPPEASCAVDPGQRRGHAHFWSPPCLHWQVQGKLVTIIGDPMQNAVAAFCDYGGRSLTQSMHPLLHSA